jgi:UDP-N-acetylmuramyl pentapeptide phosphotransferase/UDP-N-acetylglucosamine-1-phosphate transferase
MSGLDPRAVLAAIALAAVACAAVTLAIMPLLARYALARPNARSSHVRPTPQGAGIAVMLTTLSVAGALIAFAAPAATPFPALAFAAAVLIAVVGAADDIRPIPVLPRLLLQAVSVGAIIFAAPVELRIVPVCPFWLERTVLFLCGLWFVNLVNFMDGLDWMTVAEVVPIAAALVALGLFGALPVEATIVAAALAGAMLGFAPFNRPVAKVFLGDVGSLPIGLVLGWCLLELAFRHHPAAALLLPLYYLTDATVTLLRRIASREAFWNAHRTHFYQRATDNGWSVRGVVGRVFAVNVVLAILAGLSVALHSAIADAVLLAAGAIAVTLLLIRFSARRR